MPRSLDDESLQRILARVGHYGRNGQVGDDEVDAFCQALTAAAIAEVQRPGVVECLVTELRDHPAAAPLIGLAGDDGLDALRAMIGAVVDAMERQATELVTRAADVMEERAGGDN